MWLEVKLIFAGMMEDMVVGVADLAHVSFRITLASDPENITPVIIGNRWALLVIKLYKIIEMQIPHNNILGICK